MFEKTKSHSELRDLVEEGNRCIEAIQGDSLETTIAYAQNFDNSLLKFSESLDVQQLLSRDKVTFQGVLLKHNKVREFLNKEKDTIVSALVKLKKGRELKNTYCNPAL